MPRVCTRPRIAGDYWAKDIYQYVLFLENADEGQSHSRKVELLMPIYSGLNAPGTRRIDCLPERQVYSAFISVRQRLTGIVQDWYAECLRNPDFYRNYKVSLEHKAFEDPPRWLDILLPAPQHLAAAKQVILRNTDGSIRESDVGYAEVLEAYERRMLSGRVRPPPRYLFEPQAQAL